MPPVISSGEKGDREGWLGSGSEPHLSPSEVTGGVRASNNLLSEGRITGEAPVPRQLPSQTKAWATIMQPCGCGPLYRKQ
ncbi:hypothetical protein CRG98_034066 [Punica granatum]|uniref:Uncharacterized protein n=1 Tax=Punica granatum TaxID=22663 RepID=A0A2I0ING3_PUNGR|nr:hypothetical protein CRG98_034066 [Punica granatum]